ncbi:MULTISPECIES: FtsX-like permease family protein [Streptomyces]|uniref:FtsX-like permease family protein n=1 Tax=Streptomyces koelreuteriae TaxID=2838015 RepID=A0ABX8FYT3_9ACTN|nr:MULTISPECIES: FtsX-like permease family protein [Streptomyces]QWB26246.1 FtsX-like permease family protein [Streptomyces koelreuteriae]UUA09322.1 FtsX-like permease family protein [Streptomyces koelreuteriae]UUA16926.1 FtsX-like permease family protein [Streptomyces sp. CRCS-T-1]
MTGLLLLRLRAHRLLLVAALLAVLLTTSVLAALAAFSGSVGDAALRGALDGRAAASASLVVEADVPRERREAARRAVEQGAREAFGGLPVTVRTLERSGPYALPRSLQAADAPAGEPDLTHLAALDRSRIRLVSGGLPGPAPTAQGEAVPVALPEAAADRLKLRPGARVTLTDRLGGKPLRVRVTGVYRAADSADPYWQADILGGQGVRTVAFTTYGPLLADASALASGRVTADGTGWVATADYRTVTTDGIGALRAAAVRATGALREDPALGGDADVRTELPEVLDRTGRSLLVARSTLMIVSVQLVLLAGYALLLVARLLDGERAGETELLRARGGSRGRIAGLAALEALLLAVPAAVCAALLSGPLARLLARWSSLEGIGLRLDAVPAGRVWLVAGGVAAACAVAVVAPALAATAGTPVRLRRVRATASAAPVRAGADVALLLIAGVAYWQLDRQTDATGGGVLSRDRAGDLGIDPLLVAAPALALLAGTVLTLRLLPLAARLAERRSASGRGLPAALAGWQFSRRPLRGAGPVLLLVIAVATGMLAIGHGASWDRSQDDQADFRTGAAVRVLDYRPGSPGQTGLYAALPGARDAAPAHRAALALSGDREATVLALDTAHAGEGMLMRGDLADEPPATLLRALAPPARDARRAVRLPDGTRRLALDARITDAQARTGRSPSGRAPQLTVVVEDRYGIGYRLGAGNVPVDGRVHRITLDLDVTATGRRAAPAGPLRLTGLQLDDTSPVGRSEKHRFTVERLLATGRDGSARTVPVPAGTRWQGQEVVTENGEVVSRGAAKPAVAGDAPLTVSYGTGAGRDENFIAPSIYTVGVTTAGARAPKELAAVATRDFLRAAGAEPGDTVDVPLSGEQLRVRIVRAVEELPTAATDLAGETVNGGALLLDLRAVDAVLAQRSSAPLSPTEWWVSAAPGKADEVAAALRARPDLGPNQVLVRDETAAELLRDPLGAGPRSALTAVAVAAALLAAGGFAVSAAGARRERSAEFAVLRALGAPRRDLARLVATEQSLLIGVGLLAGLGLGTVLTRAVVPLIVLTSGAGRPVPPVLVELPLFQVVLLLAGVAAPLLLITVASALRRAEPAVALRHQGED